MKRMIAVSGSNAGDDGLAEEICGRAERTGFLIAQQGESSCAEAWEE
jgi:hypothetical protein